MRILLPAKPLRPLAQVGPPGGLLPPSDARAAAASPGAPLHHAPPCAALPHLGEVEPKRQVVPFKFTIKTTSPHLLFPRFIFETVTLNEHSPQVTASIPSAPLPLRPYKRCHHLGHFPRSALPHLTLPFHAPSRRASDELSRHH
jgi:hypothetical protein